jgi:hypothetical protein
MLRLGQAVIDVVLGTCQLEGVGAERLAAFQGELDIRRGRALVTGCGEVSAVIGQHGVDLVGDRFDQGSQAVCRDPRGGLLVQLDKGELGGPIDCHEQVKLAFLGANLGDIDVEVADRVGLELALVRRVAFDLWQAGDAVALQAAMQR